MKNKRLCGMGEEIREYREICEQLQTTNFLVMRDDA